MEKKLKNQALKRLDSSRSAELVAKPGRLPSLKVEEGFLRRVRPQVEKSAKNDRILAATRLMQHQQWAQVAHSVLAAMHRIFGTSSASAPLRSSRGPKRRLSSQEKLRYGNDTLLRLLDGLKERAAGALTAEIITNQENELKAQRDLREEVLGQERHRLRGDSEALIYPSHVYITNPLFDLRK